MKILHTGDWHLGKRLDRFDRLPEQALVLDEICTLAEAHSVDAVVIAGDLYDTYNPPTEATQLFFKTAKRLSEGGKRAVIVIAGNHDSPDRIEAPEPLAMECGILLSGFPHTLLSTFALDSGLSLIKSEAGYAELRLPGHAAPLRLILTPYANEQRMRKALSQEDAEASLREALQTFWADLAFRHCHEPGVNLLVGHLYMMEAGGEAPEEPEDEKPIHIGNAQAIFSGNLPEGIQYCALGHLHRTQRVPHPTLPVWYSGSPLSYSFSEAGQQKHVLLLDLEPEKPAQVEKIPLKQGFPLVRKTFSDIGEAVAWLSQNQECYVELSLRTTTWIGAEDRRRMVEAHPRVIGPIPILDGDGGQGPARPSIDLSQGMETLFGKYYETRKGKPPGAEVMGIFKEILGKEAGQ